MTDVFCVCVLFWLLLLFLFLGGMEGLSLKGIVVESQSGKK